MRNRVACLAAAAGLLLLQSALLAHHGTAGYNTKDPVMVDGVVTDFQFVNPHCVVSLNAKDAKGEDQKWQGELTSPNHLLRAGWNSHSIKPGDKITITGWRSTSGANSMWITKTVVNGQELKTAAGD
ncbi:MAG: hypothetical protein C5B51_21735 [Terriglobia bacterium]|nr:MAG: hypothetical protein C5B51_21735 [Terriglobia bacterium]